MQKGHFYKGPIFDVRKKKGINVWAKHMWIVF